MEGTIKVLFITTYPPRTCGIGTFARDLTVGLRKKTDCVTPHIAAIDISDDDEIEYGDEVVCRINNCRAGAYAEVAAKVNASDYDAVCVQHEFGIFSGEWGKDLVNFYVACEKPIVTTLHTIIPRCLELPRRIISTIVRHSAATVVMARIGVDILHSDYNVRFGNIKVIPHGVPSFRRIGGPAAKKALGLEGKDVISSFGLLSRGKGLEYMIAAMPHIVKQHPRAIYCVLGQTHPVVRKNEGESYREELHHMARTLGLENHVRFVNRFIVDEKLSVFLEATDVYVTPYLGPDQITSGAMARAVFFGKPIVSTPFLYATELLANGRGRLVQFRDSTALAQNVAAILSDRTLRLAMEASTLCYGRRMAWRAVAREYAEILTSASSNAPTHATVGTPDTTTPDVRRLIQA
ncbi:MAG: glycosyltransferase [Planctomycetes bacterium]|nr:glycosyltransferase [Planctomycetota bacterium]